MSFTKPLHGFSFDCPWFNRLVSLHRSLVGLHPVDICFLNNKFRAFWPSYFLDALFSKREFRILVLQELFRAFICQNIGLPIDNLHVAVCSFDEYAMSLDHSIGHDSFKIREQNVYSRKTIYNLLSWKNINICLIKMGELIFITMRYFLLGLITDLDMNTLTVCWFNRMKHY